MGAQVLATAVQHLLIDQGVDPSLQFAGGGLQIGFAPAGGGRNRAANPYFEPDQSRQTPTHSKGSVAVEDGHRQKRST